jgi:hypothetical protein
VQSAHFKVIDSQPVYAPSLQGESANGHASDRECANRSGAKCERADGDRANPERAPRVRSCPFQRHIADDWFNLSSFLTDLRVVHETFRIVECVSQHTSACEMHAHANVHAICSPAAM